MDNLKLKVVEKVWETPQSCTFYFENTAGQTVFYKPGQFLTFLLEIGGKEVRRCYSICTVPVKDKMLGITVKRAEQGLASIHFTEKINIGDVLECLHPSGQFYPTMASKNRKEYFLIGAGSGIVPLFSILQTLLFKEPHSTVHLVYANRDEQSIIFNKKLANLELQYSDRLNIVHVLSRPSSGWLGFKGRLNEDLLVDIVQECAQEPKQETMFFLCGPHDFMKMAERTLVQIGYPNDTIKKEDFASNVTVEKSNGIHSLVKIIYKNQEYEFQISEGQSILDAALENGIKIPYSCTNGVCTACIGTCVDGKVDFSSSDALSKNEIAQGYVLTCVGYPLTSNVTIRVD